MKKTIRKSLVVIFMFGTLFNYANKNGTLLNKENDYKGKTLIIKDENQQMVYHLKIKNSGNASDIINSTLFEDGIFTAEIDKGFEIKIKTFKVVNGKVSYLTNREKTIFKPVVKKFNNLISISKLAFDKEPLKISLYYNHKKIFNETLKGQDIIERVYHLSKNKKGKYKVVIINNGRKYIENFKL